MKRVIVYLSICVGIIVFTCYCFYNNGYFPSVNSNIKIDLNATNTFAVIIAGVFAGLTSLLTIENIRKFSIRSFEEQLNTLIKRQIELREQLEINQMLSSNKVSTSRDCLYFTELYTELFYLNEGMKVGGKFDFERLEADYYSRCEERKEIPTEMWDEDTIEDARNDAELLKIGKVMSEYGNPPKKVNEEVIITAYKHIFKKYRSIHIAYYRHLVYLLKYIKRNTNQYFLKELQEDYVRLVKANMSEYEITMLYYFAKAFDKEQIMEEIGMFTSVQYLLQK